MYVERAYQYALDVLSGEIPACLYVRQACQRFIDDLTHALGPSERFWFDGDRVEFVCKRLELFPHVKGKWAAKKETFKLSDWQIFIVANIFGFKKVRDGVQVDIRRFREAYIEVPRKNGKTFLIVGIGLIMLTMDGEVGAEVYCGATSEKQETPHSGRRFQFSQTQSL